ncbi:MAG: translational GTPase TypA [Eubacteriales bacterium]|nr:translational GTPase TypA [Clostridiales bacterium]MDD7772951.1 translational GTPase TypA [Eubacteriales bacterium]MDY3942586.1 translational GTPase TypA [Eubacteriales bacterium]
MVREDLRNVAIIAHVDHGKTTLVDEMLKQGGAYHENQTVRERVMDSGDLERERGITILAKNTSVHWHGVKINIVDTPGHADFGGEVERILKMVNGVILLVDAAEGPMPQTRFVLQRAMELGHRVIVVINKIDRPDARLTEVPDEVLELLMELDATDEQLDSPVLFCSGRAGTASFSPDVPGTDLTPLFQTILDYIPAPEGDPDAPLQLLVSSIDYNDYVGRIGIGRIERGTVKVGEDVMITNYHNPDAQPKKTRIVSLYQFDGLARDPVDQAKMGDIVCFSGAENITIGDTITSPLDPTPLTFVKVSEPTLEMTFSVNDSPFAGREGKFVTSRQLRERLYKETLKDVSLRVQDGETTDCFKVAGRGEMHLSILIETMRREGYELCCSNPHVLFKEIDGVTCEPMERVSIDVPEAYVGSVVEKLGARKGELLEMGISSSGTRMRIEYSIPSRCLFGYRSDFMTDTRGEGIINSLFDGYQPYKGEITTRFTGSLVASEEGEATSYGLYNTQDRGVMFIGVQTPVYEGMIVGECPKKEDIAVNVCKKKHLTSIRSAGADEALRLVPAKILSLEQAIEFIANDELIEVTPKTIRLRKRILNTELRLKAEAKLKK